MKLVIITGCDVCPVGKYITHMYENKPVPKPACNFPADPPDGEDEAPVRWLSGGMGVLPDYVPTDCPLLAGDLLLRADKKSALTPE